MYHFDRVIRQLNLCRKRRTITHTLHPPRERFSDINFIDDNHRQGLDYRGDTWLPILFDHLLKWSALFSRYVNRTLSSRCGVARHANPICNFDCSRGKKSLSGDHRKARVADKRGNGYRFHGVYRNVDWHRHGASIKELFSINIGSYTIGRNGIVRGGWGGQVLTCTSKLVIDASVDLIDEELPRFATDFTMQKWTRDSSDDNAICTRWPPNCRILPACPIDYSGETTSYKRIRKRIYFPLNNRRWVPCIPLFQEEIKQLI